MFVIFRMLTKLVFQTLKFVVISAVKVTFFFELVTVTVTSSKKELVTG